MQSLTNKHQAYQTAYTTFKRHEAWGWHLMTPFAEGASETEKATIQAGVNRYNDLREAYEVAKRVYEQSEAEATSPVDHYRAECILNWKVRNNLYRNLRHYFRHFSVKDGQASFQVAKDGACYKDMPLDVKKLLMPGLKLWASVLRLPYASKMCRAKLEETLTPVLQALANGPSRTLIPL
jgi:hypothetical protein